MVGLNILFLGKVEAVGHQISDAFKFLAIVGWGGGFLQGIEE